MIEINFGNLVVFNVIVLILKKVIYVELIFDLMIVLINGYFSFKLILNIVGFVILSNVEIFVVDVIFFNFLFCLIIKNVVIVVLFCVILDIVVIGNINDLFVLVVFVINVVFIVIKL